MSEGNPFHAPVCRSLNWNDSHGLSVWRIVRAVTHLFLAMAAHGPTSPSDFRRMRAVTGCLASPAWPREPANEALRAPVTRNLTPASLPSAGRYSVGVVLHGAQAPPPGRLPGLTGWSASVHQGRVRGSRL